ncbi:hypothetical protein JCM17846_31790 [Iodidimonas nitroreducens]|uniref:histidine kinase n=1 Tax=Iodidimonas nitroreducens TaxID=1236968 RepID=A0A5A7NC32_9PROT|nr:PAS domain-containing sensor histidine kinase [Iodidimonas nitroreducens]GAK34027.1 non-motile and phage-resistance protein [alpha proteobacterium Q-1]GER05497.1 hypothetical protein JCM17846_31790 [Iodidimonas nitroreducens]
MFSYNLGEYTHPDLQSSSDQMFCQKICAAAQLLCPSVIIINLAKDGRILWMNEQATANFYGTLNANETMQFCDLISPEDQPSWWANFHTLIRTRVNKVQIAFHGQSPVGKAPRFRGHIIALDDDQGATHYFVSVQVVSPFISEEDHFRHITQQALQGIIVHRHDRVLYINQKMAEILGLDDYRKIGSIKDIANFVHPDDQDIVRDRYAQAVQKGTFGDLFDFRLIAADGKSVWVSCRFGTIRWHGRAAIVSSFFDITETKRQAYQSSETEKLFTRILEISPDVVAISRLSDGTYYWVNKAFTEFFKWERSDVIGRSGIALGIWKEPDQKLRLLSELERHGVVQSFETIACDSAGRSYTTSLHATKIRYLNEDFIVTVGRDITPEKEQRKALEHSMLAAELANRAKTDFLANMSHELRTPLNAVIGFSGLIIDQKDRSFQPAKIIDYAENIQAAGHHLLQIVNDLLDMSRIEIGAVDLKPEDFDLWSAFDQVIRLLQPKIDEQKLRMQIAPIPDGSEVHADFLRTRQIIINLLTNAIKFTPEGGSLVFSIHAESPDFCSFSIKDSGIGMAEDEIARAMQPFGRADNSYTRQHDGVGLGLPIVQNLASLMQGRVVISSAPGEGTEVTISLPRAQPH